MRDILVILFLIGLAALAACQGGPVQADMDGPGLPPGSFIDLADTLCWTLGGETGSHPPVEYLKDLADTLALYGIEAAALPGEEFRLGCHDGDVFADWIRRRDENRAEFLEDAVLRLDSGYQSLITGQGVDMDLLEQEILGCGSYLESLTGVPCEVFAYPCHVHDVRDMEFLRDRGFRAGRNGMPGYLPWGSFLLDEDDRFGGWGSVALYETPISLSCAEVQAVDPEDMEAWLAATYLPEWLGRNQWVQLFTHCDDASLTGTAVLDSLHLGAFLDALLASEEFWIAPVGEVAGYLRETHSPSDSEALLWRCGDRSDRPWKGRRCAFSFSSDDGFLANLSVYQPLFAARALSYTAFLNRHKIERASHWTESPYMDPWEVSILSQSGVEIGNHGANHRCLLRPEACQVRLNGPEDVITLEIRSDGGEKQLRLWKEAGGGEQ